jgi:TPR repeat protein
LFPLQDKNQQNRDLPELNIGWMCYNGEGAEQNYKKALNWYKKSAEQGNASAQCKLGAMYDNGNWLKKSAEPRR